MNFTKGLVVFVFTLKLSFKFKMKVFYVLK